MKIFPLSLLLLLPAGFALAQATPPLPYESKGLCPFECCTYSKNWVAERNIPVLASMNAKAPVAFSLKKGEKVEGVTGSVITSSWGKAKGAPLSKTYPSRLVQPNESVDVISYLGEGCFSVWKKGKVVQACSEEIHDPNPMPKNEWWVQIKNSSGQSGWVNWPAGEYYFSGVDACG